MAQTAQEYLDRMAKTRAAHLKNIDTTGKRIQGIYAQAAKDLAKRAAAAKDKSLTKRWQEDYQKALERRVAQMREELGGALRSGMRASARLPGETLEAWLDDALSMCGVEGSFTGVFSKTPDDVLRALLDGRMYRDGKSLSRRIWNATDYLQGNIEDIVAQGIAQKRSALNIAKDLEAYVNPKAKMPVSWLKLYPDIPFDRQIDYNAQRLARTAINHAYWAANVETAQKNPFCTAMHWQLSPSHYERQVARFGEDVCDTYASHDEGLGRGNFPIRNLPMPHAQCLCVQYQVVPELNDVADRLSKWVDGGADPALDDAFGAWRMEHGFIKNKYMESIDGLYVAAQDDPNPVMVQKAADLYRRVADDFPALKDTLQVIGFGADNGCGIAPNGHMYISLDSEVWKDGDSLSVYFESAKASGHTRNASDPMFILAHELGHALDNTLALKRIGAKGQLSPEKVAAFSEAKKENARQARAILGYDISDSEMDERIAAELGERAADSDEEMIAQAVATWYYGDNDHPIADAIMQMLREEL